MATTLLTLAAGGLLLTGGAALLVKGAAALALRLGLTPLLVGLTVVAFGTSAPEFTVSVQAALDGLGGVAIGNAVGSNIANVGLILAVAALIKPIETDRGLFRRDLPLMVGVSALAALLLLDGRLGRVEGVGLAAVLVGYVVWSTRQARVDTRAEAGAQAEDATPRPAALPNLLLVAVGLAGLVVGAQWLVRAAVVLAQAGGVSNAVIGLTVVAIGTSLPELATSSVAALRGESEIAVGNVIGSNLFNLLGVLGGAALAQPLFSPGLRWEDVAVMLVFAGVLVPMMRTGWRLERWEGAVLLAGYAGYVAFLASSVS